MSAQEPDNEYANAAVHTINIHGPRNATVEPTEDWTRKQRKLANGFIKATNGRDNNFNAPIFYIEHSQEKLDRFIEEWGKVAYDACGKALREAFDRDKARWYWPEAEVTVSPVQALGYLAGAATLWLLGRILDL